MTLHQHTHNVEMFIPEAPSLGMNNDLVSAMFTLFWVIYCYFVEQTLYRV